MRLRLRLLYLLLSSCWKKRLGILDESVITLTVLPNDVDIMKMTNDRYVSLMDLGRMDLIYRSGLLKLMFNNKWAPVATFAAIRFRYPLKVFRNTSCEPAFCGGMRILFTVSKFLNVKDVYWQQGMYALPFFDRMDLYLHKMY